MTGFTIRYRAGNGDGLPIVQGGGNNRHRGRGRVAGAKGGPLTETCCVLPATSSVLLVTVMPALRLRTDCGVKTTDTSHGVPAESDVDNVHGFVCAGVIGEIRGIGGICRKDQGLITQVRHTCCLCRASASSRRCTWKRQRTAGNIGEQDATVTRVRNIQIPRWIHRDPKRNAQRCGRWQAV